MASFFLYTELIRLSLIHSTCGVDEGMKGKTWGGICVNRTEPNLTYPNQNKHSIVIKDASLDFASLVMNDEAQRTPR
jgi:hypothetical protein